MSSHTYVIEDGVWRELCGMFVISIGLHMLAFFLMFAVFHISSKKVYLPPVYTVDLVSLPVSPSVQKKSQLARTPTEPIYKEGAILSAKGPVKEYVQRKIAKKPILTNDRQVKEKLVEVPKVIRSSIERIQKSLSPEKKIESAIAAIRAKVGQGQTKSPPASAGILGGSSAGTVPDEVALQLRIYYTQIWKEIRNNWVLPEQMIRDKKNLQAIVVIEIRSDGKIVHIEFERESGDDFFDRSVIKAVQRSSPLPPLPKEYMKPTHEIGIRFNLSELEAG
ncbi:MAG TPA: TonB family protein [Syntrophaceae bacterium]|nr:TonB family protein [Syntrophaceae bacterium]